MKYFPRFIMLLTLFLAGCIGLPKGVVPVENFELQRYLGRWYEIARLNHSFEEGLDAVTADYTMRVDGGVRVVNTGRDSETGFVEQAEGRAYFVGDPSSGHLKVSFFGPFFGSYVIFELDQQDYQYAFVSGYNRDYLWLLARTPQVSEALIQYFERRVTELGFESEQLIFVQQD